MNKSWEIKRRTITWYIVIQLECWRFPEGERRVILRAPERKDARHAGAAMEASRRLLKELCDEATCSICLEYFKDPVMLDCGHNFCQACLARCWGETARGFSCPQCRETAQQRSIRSNWQLANMIEILRKLEEDSRREGALGVCERHREPLKLFCRDDDQTFWRAFSHRVALNQRQQDDVLIFLLIPSKLLFLVSAVNFTLDPNTANPFLILSDDLKSVRRGSKYQVLPDNPERFDIMMSVLGREIFTSGRHWWEVEVEENLGRWAVGVARESVRRKGVVRISPDEGFWAVGKSFRDSSSPCQILAFTSPKPLPLTLRRKLRKIRVFLDYEEDRVEFFDVDSDDLIFTFHSASFSGEKILPFFRVWRGVRLKC
uniref:Zinc finger protein RFP-like n=1 Tax=Varanus komodoensis TaxID=61221 RepID=A0A8D2IVA4_VARKO